MYILNKTAGRFSTTSTYSREEAPSTKLTTPLTLTHCPDPYLCSDSILCFLPQGTFHNIEQWPVFLSFISTRQWAPWEQRHLCLVHWHIPSTQHSDWHRMSKKLNPPWGHKDLKQCQWRSRDRSWSHWTWNCLIVSQRCKFSLHLLSLTQPLSQEYLLGSVAKGCYWSLEYWEVDFHFPPVAKYPFDPAH